MTAALEEGEWSAELPGRTLPPGKTRYPFYRTLGGRQGRSGRAENLVRTGIRSRTVQPVAHENTLTCELNLENRSVGQKQMDVNNYEVSVLRNYLHKITQFR